MIAAHINENGEEQSVFEHLKNTAKLASEYASKAGLSQTAEIQGLLHDVGKLTEDFNKYIHGDSTFSKGELDHSYAGARYLFSFAKKMNSPPVTEVSRKIAHTIVSHHGLHDWIKDDGRDYFSERITGDDRYQEMIDNFNFVFPEKEIEDKLENASQEFMALYNKIRELNPVKDKVHMAFYMGMFERLLQSFLIDADRTDTISFMSGNSADSSSVKPWPNMKKKLESKLEKFEAKTDRISLQRKSISERCRDFADHKVGTCRLIVPTGGGKTLSSLRFALEYGIKYNTEKIFYIAPFMSILEQNSEEIRSLTGDELFLEHHSNMLFEIDGEELTDYHQKADRWDVPVIATTLVQFLNTLFSSKTSSVRRMHQLCNSVIIIDEVQSVPLPCVNLFNLAVNFLSRICGCTIVLCSATQPDFSVTDYPVIYDERKDMAGDCSKDFEIFRRTELIPNLIPEGYSYDAAADYCYEKFQEYGSLLMVVNTKNAASEIYSRVKKKICDDTETVHLSTNMCPQHRKDIICKIRNLLSDNKKIICITTQLIEAGVDISFGCVVRSLAGMDNAAQAAGRCNRHGEKSEICPVFIINISDENLTGLKEIKSAQDISRQIFEIKRFSDYLSPETLEAYFRKLYIKEKDNLSYNVKENQTTILDMLSLNQKCWSINKDKSIMFSAQAFKTAGEKFEVICSDTYSVLVPYNEEAEKYICDLNGDISNEDFIRISRKAQKYCISVYAGSYRKLIDTKAVDQLKSGIVVLKKNFFDDETGINIDGSVPELLMY